MSEKTTLWLTLLGYFRHIRHRLFNKLPRELINNHRVIVILDDGDYAGNVKITERIYQKRFGGSRSEVDMFLQLDDMVVISEYDHYHGHWSDEFSDISDFIEDFKQEVARERSKASVSLRNISAVVTK